MARSASTYSFSRGAGGDQGTEKRRSLWPFTCEPSPSVKRPWLVSCRSQEAFATTIGLRGNAIATLVASRSLSVVTADTASGRNGSCLFSLVETPSRSEEHTSELQSLMRISYAVFCLKK